MYNSLYLSVLLYFFSTVQVKMGYNDAYERVDVFEKQAYENCLDFLY